MSRYSGSGSIPANEVQKLINSVASLKANVAAQSLELIRESPYQSGLLESLELVPEMTIPGSVAKQTLRNFETAGRRFWIKMIPVKEGNRYPAKRSPSCARSIETEGIYASVLHIHPHFHLNIAMI